MATETPQFGAERCGFSYVLMVSTMFCSLFFCVFCIVVVYFVSIYVWLFNFFFFHCHNGKRAGTMTVLLTLTSHLLRASKIRLIGGSNKKNEQTNVIR